MKSKIKKIFIPCQENNYRPKILSANTLFYYLLLILVLRLSLLPIFLYFPKSFFFAEITKDNLIQLVNQARQAQGLQPLRENPKLDQAASLKARDMLEKDYFSHQSPEGTLAWDLIKGTGYNYQFAGENLAVGFLESEQVYSAWMDSPLHKDNILNPHYQEIGIAVLKGEFQGNETQVVVQLFGAPKPVSSGEVLAKESEEISGETIKETIDTPPESLPSPSLKAPSSMEEVESFQPPREEAKGSFSFRFWHFITSNYHAIVQKFIYFSLILIILFLFITVFYDIFIYHRFKIDYQDIIFKTVGFCLLLVVLLYLDKMTILNLLTLYTFKIY